MQNNKMIYLDSITIGWNEIEVGGFIGGFDGQEFDIVIPWREFDDYANEHDFKEGYRDDAEYYQYTYDRRADLIQFILSTNKIK